MNISRRKKMDELFDGTATNIYNAIQPYFHPYNITKEVRISVIKLLVAALTNAFLMGKSYQSKEDSKQLRKTLKGE